ncbi:mannose-1-phosphate guanylyltransferase [Psychroflexus aestuariivivens]|uniref:mannose-1-phosphate guanylyltransferase n=1 Tax=Psychroflexus aestuariivivens TaxID=1795040 RepID=UPI002938EE38|nr:mannose-1-phosphate guanylyltransferase [Psychroflexus aestuariivivens]
MEDSAHSMKKQHILLTGGVGSRLWPLSRKSCPKQYLPLIQGKSLFQLCIERNAGLVDAGIIVGNKDNYKHSRTQASGDYGFNYDEIIEAVPKNTAAAIAFAALATNPEDLLLVTPADHVIDAGENYEKAITYAFQLAEQGAIVTFGVKPNQPETGYGYIEHKGLDVLGFKEKPNQDLAEKYIKAGNFLWNSGIFCFQAKVFLEALKQFEPEIYEKSRIAYEARQKDFLPEHESEQIPELSVDYAVMERSKNIKVVSADFYWSDLGSFSAIYDYFKLHDLGRFDQSQNLILNSNKHIELPHVSEHIYVETKDAVLLVDKNQAQDVKQIHNSIKTAHPELT